jgi:hypothetical protein
MHRGEIYDDERENGDLELERWRNISFSAHIDNQEHPSQDTPLQEDSMTRNEQGNSLPDSRKGKSRHENEVPDAVDTPWSTRDGRSLGGLLSGSGQYDGLPGLNEDHTGFMNVNAFFLQVLSILDCLGRDTPVNHRGRRLR